MISKSYYLSFCVREHPCSTQTNMYTRVKKIVDSSGIAQVWHTGGLRTATAEFTLGEVRTDVL